MESRARSIVFWPRVTNGIRAVRELCSVCKQSAPSQAATPAIHFGGCRYLVAGEQISGWVEIFKAPHGTAQADAQGLIAALRALFATFGVPEETSSDGGPEWSSAATAEFLTRWEVRHSMSSAYSPSQTVGQKWRSKRQSACQWPTLARPTWREIWSQKKSDMRVRMPRCTEAYATTCTSIARRQSIPAKPTWFTP